MCWGMNVSGQLGNGSVTWLPNSPGDVIGLTSNVVDIAAGISHTCALMDDGRIRCWGDNSLGQLGDGTAYQESTVPVELSRITNDVVAISAGGWHTCAQMQTGIAKCWGANHTGQLGDGTPSSEPSVPVDVNEPGVSWVTLSAGGYHSCGLTSTAEVKCWGSNGNGQLGVGATNVIEPPIDVVGLSGPVSAISTGDGHACALTAQGGVQCWGANSNGQLGDGTLVSHFTPADVDGLTTGVVAINAGGKHTCALMNTGTVKCWGHNQFGQLGDQTTWDRLTPVDVAALPKDVISITAGSEHSCAFTMTGGAWCWGSNLHGQLGVTTAGYGSSTAREVWGLPGGVVALEAGDDRTCALTSVGGAKCWGDLAYGRPTVTSEGAPPISYDSQSPTDEQGWISGGTLIAVGESHNCAFTVAPVLVCWGENVIGRVGWGSYPGYLLQNSLAPVPVPLLDGMDIKAISSAYQHDCVVTTRERALFCWGHNEYGQGGLQMNRTPLKVEGLADEMIGVSASSTYTCAVTASGGAKCWGLNMTGNLGVDPGWNPVDVIQLSGGPDTSSLSGYVLDLDGQPVSGAMVTTNYGQTATTDADGQYVLNDLTRGFHSFVVQKAGYGFTQAALSVKVPAPERSRRLRAMPSSSFDFQPSCADRQTRTRSSDAPVGGFRGLCSMCNVSHGPHAGCYAFTVSEKRSIGRQVECGRTNQVYLPIIGRWMAPGATQTSKTSGVGSDTPAALVTVNLKISRPP